jgi:hypothetical protein
MKQGKLFLWAAISCRPVQNNYHNDWSENHNNLTEEQSNFTNLYYMLEVTVDGRSQIDI